MIKYDQPLIKEKTSFIRKETLLLHSRAPSTRIASALSTIEIFSVLFYGGFHSFKDKRNRLLISKAHGCFSLYPILFDFDIISYNDLENIGKQNALLGTIPDCNAPHIINNGGALGNALGVGCGMAKAFKYQNKSDFIYIIIGDGECNEGAVWEAIAFAGHHKLDNIIAIFDDNKKSMLGEQKDILDCSPLAQKLSSFGWETHETDGHNTHALFECLNNCVVSTSGKPKAVIADTIKGKGIKKLEDHPLCHILSLSQDEVQDAIKEMEV
jgi:transketolase